LLIDSLTDQSDVKFVNIFPGPGPHWLSSFYSTNRTWINTAS